MPTTAAIPAGDGEARPLASAALLLLFAALLWPVLAGGAHAGWPLVVTELLVLAALLTWALGMLDAGRLEWRRTALDRPLPFFIALILLQLVIGNAPLRRWALAPPAAGPEALPHRFLLGSVAPAQTARSLLLFLTYVGVYVLVVNLVRHRRDLDRLVRGLLVIGVVLVVLSIVDYLLRESLPGWRQAPAGHRLTGPFVNPDHWASWMVMLICLGIGYLAARRGSMVDPLPGQARSSRAPRDSTFREFLPLFALALVALATVLTLSRGALLAVLAAGLMLLTALARVRGRLWVLVLAAVLGVVTLLYALWIGIDPLLSRLSYSDQVGRLEQWRSSLPMLASFPVLGVGLGAYKDIYFRFQPAVLLPGRVYFPYAHSDILQLLIETGPLGAALGLWAAWRVAADLVGAHLLGRGRCPVAAGPHVRRSDPFSVGIMLGALAAVVALGAHSLVDFSARIPADGVLAAACLGMATVAAHTRFGADGSRSLAKARAVSLDAGRRCRAAIGALITLAGACFIPVIVRQGWAAGAPVAGPELRIEAARRLLSALPGPADPRAAETRRLAAAAADELRGAIATTPSDPYLHERLAFALELQAAAEPARGPQLRRAAFAHMERAIALQPENPLLRRSLAALALAPPEPKLELALEAGRAAAERDPALFPGLVEQLAPFAPSDAQWAALAPPDPIDRADLALQLESRGFLREARTLYERSAEGASPNDEAVIRWLEAQLLLAIRRPADALPPLAAALIAAPGNPELLLLRARALEASRSPETLDAYRAALASAEGRRGLLFATESPRLRAIVAERLGDEMKVSPARYRRALAQRLTEERQWAPALEEWDRARREAPLDAQGEFSRGLALEGTGERRKALEAFRRAVKLGASDTAFRAHLAARLWEDEQYMQAISEWQAIASAEPGNVEAALSLARAYVKIGDRPRALGEYRRVLGLAPGLAEARQFVGRLDARP